MDTFDFNKYMNERRPLKRGELRQKRVPCIKCADGFEMSVQADEFAYCAPRVNTDWYYKVEVGFPSEREDLLMPYVEDASRPTETVYGYVPVGVVNSVVDKHGGLEHGNNNSKDVSK